MINKNNLLIMIIKARLPYYQTVQGYQWVDKHYLQHKMEYLKLRMCYLLVNLLWNMY